MFLLLCYDEVKGQWWHGFRSGSMLQGWVKSGLASRSHQSCMPVEAQPTGPHLAPTQGHACKYIYANTCIMEVMTCVHDGQPGG